jgi:putative ABC transport system substrate-binding protein
MKRREFLGVLGGAATAWPAVGRAQQSGKRRIGVLFALAESNQTARSRLAMFRGTLRKLGWTDVAFDTRYVETNDVETHERFAKELVALQPDLLLAQNVEATNALIQQTHTIPIIFALVSDPIGNGFVASFPRPGGNVTGFIIGEPTMGGKWLELLKEIAPDVTRVLVPSNASTATREYYLSPLKSTAALLGVDASAIFFRSMSELEAVVAEYARTPVGGLVMVPDAYMTGHSREVVSLSARYRLPTVYALRLFVDAGGLVSYGGLLLDNFRRAAIYADRVLKGEKVSELPVQAPERFELVLNLNTAKELGLTVPPALLARADEVIE